VSARPAGRRRVALAWYAVARGAVEVVSRIVWRVEVHGREHVPRSGPFVLAPVHRSNLDTLIAGCVVRRRVRFMGKDSLWKYPLAGRLFTSLGGFPVHRGAPDRESLRICEEALRAGEPVVLFPEGSEWAMPKGSRGIRPVKVVAVVGAPIPAPPRSESGRVPRRAVAELTLRLHAELQALFDDALARAGRSDAGPARPVPAPS
jgi:1-acyl-sn-glycerol-3-phosphate acyltransferase